MNKDSNENIGEQMNERPQERKKKKEKREEGKFLCKFCSNLFIKYDESFVINAVSYIRACLSLSFHILQGLIVVDSFLTAAYVYASIVPATTSQWNIVTSHTLKK